jgi:hypothetical protein
MKRVGTFFTGIVVGATLFGGTAAYAAGIMAEQSLNRILVDGQEVQLDAYAINGSNYLKLRDIGEAVGFNVYWDAEQHCVQIESDTPYTGVAPAVNREAMPSASYNQSEVKPAPQVGDIVLCSDGYTYEIKDVTKYNNSMFATEETGALPSPTCDWSLLDQPTLPAPEARFCTSGGKEYLFVRNLYETKRMQYTLYNAIGDNPRTWKNGRPATMANGDPMVRINLSIPTKINASSFWQWRSEQITEVFNSCPPGEYSMEAWDVYCNGAFRYTEYYNHVT